MVKINKYRDMIMAGEIGVLKKIVDIGKLEIAEITETDRIRVYLEFILDSIEPREIRASYLIREFCLLEKALGGEYDGKFITKSLSKSRYVPIASYDHYRVILFHGMKKLGIEQGEDKMLNEDQLKELAKIIWH